MGLGFVGGLGALPGPLGHSQLYTLNSLLWFPLETQSHWTDGSCLGLQGLPGGHGRAASRPRSEQRGREGLT